MRGEEQRKKGQFEALARKKSASLEVKAVSEA